MRLLKEIKIKPNIPIRVNYSSEFKILDIEILATGSKIEILEVHINEQEGDDLQNIIFVPSGTSGSIRRLVSRIQDIRDKVTVMYDLFKVIEKYVPNGKIESSERLTGNYYILSRDIIEFLLNAAGE